ncbi:Xenotropic and polytropic retrovirus receptor 1-like [Hondaea fermentalgiana]|uniref:Xenotropic and polytropic retrovirus receptor 1-like n=1 Tax=Hondaea fermentalgiana TaxID=2315210 RepID=A0A2R5GZZ0_9STRA|nr:Xenotropic and polytropic retrovirus receptor 1-like [Hondaea fermentalgiana]|eukprot:GBG34343.1 Xenotropic and polytropic retrovirus receptor 1-like [Hondaea fermentalgiana]
MGLGAFVNESHVYFRPPLLIALVWFLWGVDVFVFRKTHIDYSKALGFDRESTLSPAAICTSASAIIGIFLVCWLMYSLKWPFSDPLVIPGIMYIASLCILLVPLDVLNRRGRERLLHTFVRVLMPLPTGVLFAEVLLGDIMTSLSKALADMQVSVCVLLSHSFTAEDPFEAEIQGSHILRTSSTMLHEESCADSWLRPLITSLPFLLRFRQCIVAYRATGQSFPHLVNAAKYASAFPVIWISAFAHQFPSINSDGLQLLWKLAITFNSLFSFMWDVVMDWGLMGKEAHYIWLRERLLFMNDGRSMYMRVPHGDPAEEPTRETEMTQMSRTTRLKSKDSNADLLQTFKDLEGEDQQEHADSVVLEAALPQHPTFSRSPSFGVHQSQRSPMLPPLSLPQAAQFDALELGGDGGPGADAEGVSVGSGLPAARRSVDSWSSMVRQYGAALFRSAQPSRFKTAPEARNAHIMPLLPSTPIFYYAAMVFNLVLRVLWSIKLSVHLQLTQEGVTFVLELCEVVRRAVWLIFRIEWESIQIDERKRLADSIDSDTEAEMQEEDSMPVAPASIKRHASLPSVAVPTSPQLSPRSARFSPEDLWLGSPAAESGHKARQRTSSDRVTS